MSYQTDMVEAIHVASDEFFSYAHAVPEDKLQWSPMDQGRSVLSMCQEIAMSPTWAYAIFTTEKMEFDPEKMAEQHELMASWTTVAQCEAQFEESFAKVAELYRSLSDEDLKKTKWLPFNGGREHTYKEMMDYPRWNCNYHTGQVAYIQVLYGDKEMYWSKK